jgi:DNA ligase-1
MKFKPLLAEAVEDVASLNYPVMVSCKLDGIRCLIIDGVATSRSLKPIPNRFIQSVIGKPEFNGLDGELLVGDTFQQSTSGIMSEDGEPDFHFAVFDNITNPNAPFVDRLASLQDFPLHPRIRIVPHHTVNSAERLRSLYEGFLEGGHEGAMIRRPDGHYKFNRSTLREALLLKWKPFADAEATIVGFEERMHNANEAKTNALGRTERSSHKDNLVPMGTLGALVCINSDKWPGQTFNLGTGFDDFTRANIWAKQHEFLGKTVKFKYQAIGTVDKPRIPVFLGFRDGRDVS